jgi:hypothetical protein
MSDRAKRAPNALAAVNGFVVVQRAVFAGFDRPRRRVAARRVAGRSQGTTVVDRPVEGSSGPRRWENDRKLSLRVQEIHKTTDGPPDVITLYANTVKDAGLTTQREYEITEFGAPSGSAGPRTPRTSSASGPAATTSSPTAPAALAFAMWNELEGHGPGRVLGAPRAAIGARAPAISSARSSARLRRQG